jgi:hypothetical protein
MKRICDALEAMMQFQQQEQDDNIQYLGGFSFIINFCFRDLSATLQQKSHLCSPFLGIVQPQSLSPNVHIHVSLNDLYISRIGPHISCSRIGRSIVEIYKSLTDT